METLTYFIYSVKCDTILILDEGKPGLQLQIQEISTHKHNCLPLPTVIDAMIQVLVQHSLNVPFLLVILCFSVSPCWVSHKNDATTIMSIKVLTLSCLRVVAHQHQSTRSIITIFLKFPYLRKVFYFCLFFNENLLLFVDSLVYFLRTLPLFYALVNEPI